LREQIPRTVDLLRVPLQRLELPERANVKQADRAIASSRSDEVSIGIPAARIDRGLVRVSAMISAGHADELETFTLTMC
jgi:hypothetical protein